ncbi:MAG: septation protein SepH [Microbacteriaceae bacterium]|nr:septation protein SepH [Microbacteriaceae bacterium]MCL2795346.1 septation protein SepH [Microbacteriaceae bacterium]
MQDLKVIGVEDGALLAASDAGDRYRIAIDEVALTKLRRLKVEQAESGARISPREIQAHIRGGLSAEDVAELTGASLEYVQRFEGPIIAEREHIVAQALAVAVRMPADVDLLGENATFGAAIRERLAALGASSERWASWRDDEGGWIVKLSFTTDEIDHDARWNYEPRKAHLAPANAEASTLSQQGELPATGLIPRLRAVAPLAPDEARFDSGVFDFVEPRRAEPVPQASPAPAAAQPTAPVPFGAIKRAADDEPKDVQNTADLLEALRRRRGEREAASLNLRDSQPLELDFEPEAPREPTTSDTASDLPVVSGPTPVAVNASGPVSRDTGSLGTRGSSKRGRASMPSWDEIVFGARGDDDTSA